MESPFLIVGLGNPGKKYSKTRHNSGFMVADHLAAQFDKSFTTFKNLYRVTSFDLQEQRIILMKPATFMNLSGLAVAAGIGRYGIALSNVLVICDDLNLKFGVIRLRANGSDGGQKGLRSIISALGTQDFPRLRIGIDNQSEDAVEYVLSPFNKNEREYLPDIIQWAAEAVESFVLNGMETTMSRFNKNYLSRLE